MNFPSLFSPLTIGPYHLKHRVVMAPLTRSRSEQPGGIPGDMMVQYYSDRASDGGLIVGEATNISLTARGWFGAPGLYTDQQVEGWKRVVRAIHAKNGFVFAQLWHGEFTEWQDENTMSIGGFGLNYAAVRPVRESALDYLDYSLNRDGGPALQAVRIMEGLLHNFLNRMGRASTDHEREWQDRERERCLTALIDRYSRPH